MMNNRAFIETQFPVNRISKESYKERKAGAGQTLTGLGKWWGRKPLVMARAAMIGLLLPAGDKPEKDLEVFLKLMTMDKNALWQRKNKSIPIKELIPYLTQKEKETCLTDNNGKIRWKIGVHREQKAGLQKKAFYQLSYDEKLKYCARPEQIEGPSEKAWEIINAHCNTQANSLQEWVQQMGEEQFGERPKVGDAFCGGGSIPFEAARLGFEAFGSDLNPVAVLLTWASLNIIGGGKEVKQQVEQAQRDVFEKVDKQITDWGIEHNEKGWRADAYLYCVEVKSPATGFRVPLAPSWVISEKYRVCAVLKSDPANKRYNFDIVTNADNATFEKAKQGTVQSGSMVCPETGNKYPVSTIRGDKKVNGKTQYGLRLWENEDIVPRPEDTFQERLYCIRYVETFYVAQKEIEYNGKFWEKGEELTKENAEALPDFEKLIEKKLKCDFRRHYVAPDKNDLKREQKVLDLLNERFDEWQENGFIPSSKIARGYNTEQPIRERGWTHWHHLFNPRQLLTCGAFQKKIDSQNNKKLQYVASIVSTFLTIDRYSRLSGWDTHISKGPGNSVNVFYNQALNTLFRYGCRGFINLHELIISNFEYYNTNNSDVCTTDARKVKEQSHFWITDPPYADAVNYHELGDYFLAWYEQHLTKLFPKWHNDSRASLAVKGSGKDFNQSMVEVYRNLKDNMPDNGAQIIMFTHQDSRVWADLALIVWASGLKVTAAWTIQTETDAGGIKKGSYVQGTVVMILRKRLEQEIGFLSDIYSDIEFEVKEQLDFMTALDAGDSTNFSDPDYQLAAYAAALRVLTQYETIEGINIQRELKKDRAKREENPVNKIIQDALKTAMEYMVPKGYSKKDWYKLSSEERFYLKGLQVEAGKEYRSGVYTEMARGFGLHEYKYMLKTSKANQTRLKTPSEFKSRDLYGEGFGSSLLRHTLYAVFAAGKNEQPKSGRDFLYTERKDNYWEDRKMIISILRFIIDNTEAILHWGKDREAARLLIGYLETDTTS
ncbi:MAG: anti-phage-associated DUF1156 domain-containing protein [Thermodesulfobacteriota bacterium]|nr:anti-phage-associated DUF1156 domain-containing protein [Thermodesulfobacteriota bacterium]